MKKRKRKRNALMLINNTDMSLLGPLVRQITAEILHHVKFFCIIYMGNLLASIFLLHLSKHLKISFISPLQE